MLKKTAPSYPVSIFIAGDPVEAETACLDYCDTVGFCVTVTKTTYCYTGGEEAGVIVGLINYPRFPMKPEEIVRHADDLAEFLCFRLGQESYSIQTREATMWVSYRDADRSACMGRADMACGDLPRAEGAAR